MWLVSLVLLPLLSIVALRWIASSRPLQHPTEPRQATEPKQPLSRDRSSTRSGSGAGDPNLPRFGGETRRLAARAIDDTAASRFDQALVALGRRFLGTPDRPLPAVASEREQLWLDLTGADDLRLVEQLLALVNSRRVSTQTEGVDRFSDHVRQLRYAGGRVEACRRLEHRSLWAAAAARRGYLVDLTPFLPGARLQPVSLAALMHPSDRGANAGRSPSPCPLPPGSPSRVPLTYLPLERLQTALPNLRSGDLFVLVQRRPEQHPGVIGVVERSERTDPILAGLLVWPGRGMERHQDLVQLARDSPGTVGMAILRPVPNADGRPDR